MRYPVQIKGSDQYIASLVIFMYVVEVFWESPKNQKSKHLRWAWVDLAMMGETHVEVLIIWCDYFVGRRSRERVLSMESPYRGTDSVNERTYSPWAWSVSIHRFDFTLFEENLHFYTQVLYKFERLTMVHKLNVLWVGQHFFTHHWESP